MYLHRKKNVVSVSRFRRNSKSTYITWLGETKWTKYGDAEFTVGC
jgi:hypothetical protein